MTYSIISNDHGRSATADRDEYKVKTIIFGALLSVSLAAHCENLQPLKDLAASGDARAQFALAFMYDKGEGTSRDYAAAAKWYLAAAEQGIVYAQYQLGQMYELGRGVAEDRKQAVSWYRAAAEQGFTKAQYKLGDSYALGLGVPQDHKLSAMWFRRAAERGYADAQYRLGMSYAHGEHGVPQDYIRAHMWLSLAANQRLAAGRQARDLIEQDMTPVQLAESRRLQTEKITTRIEK